jgi:hypothetical protein
MDTVTVALVIRMTGLLLITPADAGGSGPVHVLFPQTGHLREPHVAQVGYRAPECAARPDGICWRDIAGLSLEVGQAAAAGPVRLPYPESNLSNLLGLHVPASFLGTAPDAGVLKSRVTLNSGAVTGACALGRWSIPHPAPGVPLANVVEWTIPDLPAESVVLRGTRLGQPGVTETIRLPTNGSGTIELYIRHLPQDEANYEDGIVTEYEPAPAIPGEPAKHFGPLYELLDGGPDARPLPVFLGETGESCRALWPIGRSRSARGPDAARLARFASTAPWMGTIKRGSSAFNCMIGFAAPR